MAITAFDPQVPIYATQGVRVSGGHTSTSTVAGAVYIAAGYTSPVSARILFGDGSGWELRIATGTAAAPVDLGWMTDTGALAWLGAVSIGGALVVTGVATFSDDIIAGLVRPNTSDAADTGFLQLAGGGAADVSRGALIQVLGNEHGGTGQIHLIAGNVADGHIIFFTGAGAQRLAVLDTGDVLVTNNIDVGGVISIDGVQVVQARKTGWALPSGTFTRTAFATSTVTTEQLAERVAAMLQDLYSHHGLIGA